MLCYRQLFWSCLCMCPVIFRLRHFASSFSSFMWALSSNSSMLTWSCQFTRKILHRLRCCLSSSFSVPHVHTARPVPPVSYSVAMRSPDDYADYESSFTIQICITSPLSHISQYCLGTEIMRWRSPLKLKKVKLWPDLNLNFVFRDMRCWPSRLTRLRMGPVLHLPALKEAFEL